MPVRQRGEPGAVQVGSAAPTGPGRPGSRAGGRRRGRRHRRVCTGRRPPCRRPRGSGRTCRHAPGWCQPRRGAILGFHGAMRRPIPRFQPGPAELATARRAPGQRPWCSVSAGPRRAWVPARKPTKRLGDKRGLELVLRHPVRLSDCTRDLDDAAFRMIRTRQRCQVRGHVSRQSQGRVWKDPLDECLPRRAASDLTRTQAATAARESTDRLIPARQPELEKVIGG